jgi:hypothetical protein
MQKPAAMKRLMYWPGEVAAQLGMTTCQLTAIIRRRRYAFTEVAPGGKPGDTGRNRWGLTVAQVEAIIRGQSKIPPDPSPIDTTTPRLSPVSPDGKSRLRKSNIRR